MAQTGIPFDHTTMRMIWDKKKVTGHHHGLLLNESSFADKKKLPTASISLTFKFQIYWKVVETVELHLLFKKETDLFFFLLV